MIVIFLMLYCISYNWWLEETFQVNVISLLEAGAGACHHAIQIYLVKKILFLSGKSQQILKT